MAAVKPLKDLIKVHSSLSSRIEDIDLNAVSLKILADAGIGTVDELVHKTEPELLAFRRLTASVLADIEHALMGRPEIPSLKELRGDLKKRYPSDIIDESIRLALLDELHKSGCELDTDTLIARAIAHFPALSTPAESNREEPSGRPWWPRRFRFELKILHDRGDVIDIKNDRWKISDTGLHHLKHGIRL